MPDTLPSGRTQEGPYPLQIGWLRDELQDFVADIADFQLVIAVDVWEIGFSTDEERIGDADRADEICGRGCAQDGIVRGTALDGQATSAKA
jgi:hypothetical protein